MFTGFFGPYEEATEDWPVLILLCEDIYFYYDFYVFLLLLDSGTCLGGYYFLILFLSLFICDTDLVANGIS